MSLPPETPLPELRRWTRPEPRCGDCGHEGNALVGIYWGVLIGAAMWAAIISGVLWLFS